MNKDKRLYNDWLELCKRIHKQTEANRPLNEEPKARKKRIESLLNDFSSFCKYYFPHYCRSEFGWFHKEAAQKITKNRKIFAVLEWPREHAKSVFADVLMPLWLKAKGELTGLILVSANQDKAAGLLADLQAELESNALYIDDFGQQATFGSWEDCHFATKDGIGFWAFGRGQSPRGARQGALRPNLAIVDDIDDKVIVKNPARVKEAVNWILEDLYGCLSIEAGRVIIVGNRIHKYSILAHLVGDIEEGDPKREGITHIKVYAFEKGKNHEKAMPDEKGAKPAWPENHKAKDLIEKMAVMGHRPAMREYFHEHHEDGIIFKDDWIRWDKPLKMGEYDGIVVYCDPSFKDTAKSDTKAIIATGRKGSTYHVLRAWVRVASVKAMVQEFYQVYEWLGNKALYYMEANMLQDLLLEDFDHEAELRGYHVPLRPDKEKKDNKMMRIENLSPLFERGFIRFNEEERSSRDMQNLILQILGFGNESMKDDGPDALEGAISKLNKKFSNKPKSYRTGKYNKKSR